MVRTIKEATVKSFHYSSINEMRWHVRDWLTAYNFAKQLKALKVKTPYEAFRNFGNQARGLYRQATPSHAGTKHLRCLGDAITSSSPIPAGSGDEVGYSA